MPKNQAKIAGVATYLPIKVLTNHELEKMVETSDEWIVSRTGIKTRHIASNEEHASTMGTLAAKKLLEKTGFSQDRIDLIIVVTLSPDYLFPSTSCLIQKNLGLKNAAAFDLQAACSGLIYGLATAKAYIEASMAKNILLIATEKLSSFINYKDRNTCVLFGDGAAALLVSAEIGNIAIQEGDLGADGEHADLLAMFGGGSRNPATQQTIDDGLHFIRMEGREVFKHAIRRMEEAIHRCLAKAKIKHQDVSYFIPHQANLRIIESLSQRFGIQPERVIKTIESYANTSAASIGIALEKCLEEKKLRKGDHLLLAAFGSGFTYGAWALKVLRGQDAT